MSSPPTDFSVSWPEGYYFFECPTVTKPSMARLRHEPRSVRIQLLGDLPGSFSLEPAGNASWKIVRAEMGYDGLPRSFSGEGTLLRPGEAAGEAVSWLKPTGPLTRNHRKGDWRLRQASPEEISRYERESQLREEKLRRLREAEAAGEGSAP